ncbi:39S ribosomal protein L51, mitochondrial [Entomophthora muscae]|uniref:39S ribosomal protein L51, mitochondrial n=1 Tax=Entomophthora muscae TaxID=34485 RepID=A0ACC2S3J2_9FUNG|nr:39S ribosomal protein L51, mitochondrial [Entomophthora muscae]
MGIKKLGSRVTAFQFGDKLSRVSSGFRLSYKDFKKPVEPAHFDNGVKGAYIVQCNRLVFSYCERGGSSRGMVEFIKENIQNLAKSNPETEYIVKHVPFQHPAIMGYYNNGYHKRNDVANMDSKIILLNAEGLQTSQGGLEKDFRKTRVLSTTPSVRGIWSPFHCAPHKI